jgi:hypothetical protein
LAIYVLRIASDCSELGRQAYLIGEDETAMGWMQESLVRYKQEADNEKSVGIEDILKYYAFSSLNQGSLHLYTLL